MTPAAATHPALAPIIAAIQAEAFPLRVLGVLADAADAPEGLTTPEVAHRLRCSSLRAGRTLAALHDVGLVARERAEDPLLPPLAYRWRLAASVRIPPLLTVPLHCTGE